MTAEPVGDALLDPARAALERGDYGRCLTLLQPLAERHPAATPFGGSVRLLMASYALMIGLWQISDPPACLAAAMERPDMYMFNVDLEKQLGAVLVNLWEGAILRHGGGST